MEPNTLKYAKVWILYESKQTETPCFILSTNVKWTQVIPTEYIQNKIVSAEAILYIEVELLVEYKYKQ